MENIYNSINTTYFSPTPSCAALACTVIALENEIFRYSPSTAHKQTAGGVWSWIKQCNKMKVNAKKHEHNLVHHCVWWRADRFALFDGRK